MGQKYLGVILCFLLLCSGFRVEAYNQDISEMSHKLEEKTEEFAGPEGLRQLKAFRQEVEKNAKTITFKLCEGYRRVFGYGPPAYHGKYMFSKAEAMGEWAKLYKHGAFVFGSAIGGYKATYNELYPWAYKKQDATWADTASGWTERITHEFFISNYMLFLIQSHGYVEGAVHCLNTTRAYEINKFTYAIIAADFSGSMTTELAVGAGVGKLLKGSIKWGFIPYRWIAKLIVKRFNLAQRLATANLLGVGSLTGALHYFEERSEETKKNVESARKLIDQVMTPNSEYKEDSGYKKRVYAFKNLVSSFSAAYEKDQMVKGQKVCAQIVSHSLKEESSSLYTRAELNSCKTLYSKFLEDLEVVKKYFLYNDFKKDLQNISSSERSEDKAYKTLLENFLPVFLYFLPTE